MSEVSTDNDEPIQGAKVCPGKKQLAHMSKAKSSLCRNFTSKGFCPYGRKCQFAHGVQELRCNLGENAYKTKPCHAFSKKAYCQYGDRCNFLHSSNIETEKISHTSGELMSFRDLIYECKSRGSSKLFPLASN